jgi:beta-glucosidase
MGNTPTLTEGDLTFRDLNKNGRLDPYEDPRRPIDERVEDLLAQMMLEEKAGLMFHMIAGVNPDGSLEPPPQGYMRTPIAEMVAERLLSHFNVHALPEPRLAATWHNRLQELAEGTRLGIPVTISSDPRHAFSNNPLTSFRAAWFSQWPEPIGLAATGDEALVEEFGDIARQEYVALGIRVALHPMADLATEPRWARISGTFGEDAQLSARLTGAYIRGFQGASLGPHSVACMTKHFPGGGPQKDGEDPHFHYGKEQVYPGDNFDYHLIPFDAAFAAGTAQIMPYYGVPIGLEFEEVAFGFNKQIVTGLLRERYGFDGVVCTDWGLLNDTVIGGQVAMVARAWGVEHLTVAERARKAIEAGVDQFGGEACPEVIVELVRSGQLAEARIDESVRRLLRDKFRLGLFDNPYLDVEAAQQIVGNPTFRAAGALAQRKSIVLLKNGAMPSEPTLPLRGRPKLYVERVAAEVAGVYAEVVQNIEDADLAILRLEAPYQPRDGSFLERLFHAGDLDFKDEEKARILGILERVPTIVAITLDRPAVIPEIAAHSAALLADFGAADDAILDVVFGRFTPSGKLPFELPSSMEAAQRQKSDVPYDSEEPLFRFGHGLSY